MKSPATARKPATPVPSARPLPCSVHFGGREVVIPPTAHSLHGFRAWALSPEFPLCGRFSYLGGELMIDMSPESIESHNKIKTELTFALVLLNKKMQLGQLYSDRTLLTNDAANLSTEPDAVFGLWETLESGRLRQVPRKEREKDYAELQGTPDWVLEIVSDSSVKKDTERLRELYFRAGIPEYWLIDARDDRIDFQILVPGSSGYVATAQQEWRASRVFHRRFRLLRELGRMGLYQYMLQVKPLK